MGDGEVTHMCRRLLFALVICCLAIAPAWAGLRWNGKYCGVVLFDRWDACTLYSGIYVMYVSEKVKEGLRPYAGQAMQIDATDVWQPINPGDGLIRAYKVLGPAPDRDDGWFGPVTGLELKVDMRVVKGKPEFRLKIRNGSDREVTIHSDHLAPTVLGKIDSAPYQPFAVADGPSWAFVTRSQFDMQGSWCIVWGRKVFWRVTSGRVPPYTHLAPGQQMVVTVLVNAPPGEYEFLCGYGGGLHASKCVASNLVSFDIGADGVARPVPTTP
jgi:hypothetical protein